MPSSAAGAASRRKTASIRASPRRPRVTPPSSARRKWRARSWSVRWRRNGRRSWWRFTPSCRAKWREKRAPPRRASASTARGGGRERRGRGESWLLEHARDAHLLAALGRLCASAGLWGKARSFLEASVSFEESRSVYLELARLAERLGQATDAQLHYRRAAEIS